MAELSEKELLLLNNLIYINSCEKNNTVGDILSQFKGDNGDFDLSRIPHDDFTSKEENLTILKQIESSDTLKDLRIVDNSNDPSTGMRVSCFVDKNNEATVVFRGTGNEYEWKDNLTGAYKTDTDAQEEALNFIDGLDDKYKNITVSGHSKGSNKAQYVALLSDKVDRCVAFDGQGFSDKFLDQYADQIKDNQYKIKAINAQKDVVNAILFPVAGEIVYISTAEQDNPLAYHKPCVLLTDFDESGNFKPPYAEQWEVAKLLNQYTENIVTDLPDPLKIWVVNNLTDNIVVPLLDGKDETDIVVNPETICSIIALLPLP